MKIKIGSILTLMIIGLGVYFNINSQSVLSKSITIANVEVLTDEEQKGWRREGMTDVSDTYYNDEYFQCCTTTEVICYYHAGSLKNCEEESSYTCDHIKIDNQSEHNINVDHGTVIFIDD